MSRFTVVVDADLEPIMERYLAIRMDELGKMEQAAQDGDTETVRILGHRLKGSGTSYGFEKLTELGAAIEIAGKESNPAQAQTLLCEVRAYLENVDVIFGEDQ